MKEEFEYLIDDYNVQIIFNENNSSKKIYSL